MSPEKLPDYEFEWAPSPAAERPSKIIDNLSPPLIAMFAVLGTALLIVLYARLISRQIRQLRRRWRRWRRCRHLLRTAASDFGTTSQSQFSPPPPYTSTFPFSPYGLDDAAIKTLPLSIFSRAKAKQLSSTNRDCAVCLFEFDDGDWLRTLPLCTHAFHVECIDVWLRSHPSCPLCRASVSFQSNSPFVPMRAARIRPSFDDMVLDHAAETASPILEERGRSFLLKRSYSFGFERSVGAERIATTVSPAWRIRQQQQQQQQRGFWSKRWQSPFGGVMKSPFVRRWGRVSASSAVMGGRRSRSMTSPSAMWMGRAVGFSSSRMRCGDPEALISPERFNRG